MDGRDKRISKGSDLRVMVYSGCNLPQAQEEEKDNDSSHSLGLFQIQLSGQTISSHQLF